MRINKMKAWNDSIAETLKFGFSDESLAGLINALATMLDSNVSAIILYPNDAKPHWPLRDFMSEREWKSLSVPYRDGAYLLDPYFHLAKNQVEGVFCMKDNIPDSFTKSEFFRLFYEKKAVVDEMCAMIKLADDVFASISICRVDNQNEFDKEAIDNMKSGYYLLSIIAKNWWDSQKKDVQISFDSIGLQLEFALEHFGESILTSREVQVAKLALQGHSIKAQAARLKLSVETVKAHKKNIYQKLDISSQSELFNLFIDSLKTYNPANHPDPLSGYL